MAREDKLLLVQQSMRLLLISLDPNNQISTVTYASNVQVVLEPTSGREQDGKYSGRWFACHTSGADCLKLAYTQTDKSFDEDGVNRIILASDGDFSINVTANDSLKSFIESKRQSGIFLSVLGMGMGNLRDDRLNILANRGNGVAAYIDTANEAQKVRVHEVSSTLFPSAKDVKIKVEFNPKRVAKCRLIGYEKRMLQRREFNNDKIDAANIGAGHTVTAMYELTLVEVEAAVDPLRHCDKEVDGRCGRKSLPFSRCTSRYQKRTSRNSCNALSLANTISLKESATTYWVLSVVDSDALGCEISFAAAVAWMKNTF